MLAAPLWRRPGSSQSQPRSIRLAQPAGDSSRVNSPQCNQVIEGSSERLRISAPTNLRAQKLLLEVKPHSGKWATAVASVASNPPKGSSSPTTNDDLVYLGVPSRTMKQKCTLLE